MPEATPDASPGPARTWSDVARPDVGRFRIAATFGLSVVHEPAESGHLAALLEDMAARLDRAVARAGEGDADAWTAVSAPLVGRFKVGAALGRQVVHNARGAHALGAFLEDMAAALDRAVQRSLAEPPAADAHRAPG